MIGKIRGNKKLRTHMCCLITCVEDFFCSMHLVKLELQKRPALTASIYKRQWDRGMPKSHNLYFIGLDGLDELTNC